MMEHMEQQRALDSVLNSQLSDAQRLDGERQAVERKVEEQRLAKLTEAQLAAEAKAQLAAAKGQVTQLASVIKARQAELASEPVLAAQVAQAMATIEKFFAADHE